MGEPLLTQFDLFVSGAEGSVSLLEGLLRTAEVVLIKKLSNNDRDWAQLVNKHQGGVYIPPAHRDGGFFPPLRTKQRANPDSPVIRETYFTTEWPQVDERRAETRLVNYTSKGAETHMTGVPKSAFSTLSPASFLVMGRYPDEGGSFQYRCLTIDSNSDDALALADTFGLDADFIIGEFRPAEALAAA